MWRMVALRTGGQAQVLLRWEEASLRGAGNSRTEVLQEVKVDIRPLCSSSHTHIIAGTAADDYNGALSDRCWGWSWGRHWRRHWRRALFFLLGHWLWYRCWQGLDRRSAAQPPDPPQHYRGQHQEQYHGAEQNFLAWLSWRQRHK